MGKDVIRYRDGYCCCRMFLIYHGIYLIAFHCFLQGVFGVGVVVTSSYDPSNNAVNYTTAISNMCFVPTGILLFWANVYRSWKAAKVCAIIIIVLIIFNLCTACAYFAIYINFQANSILDKDLFLGSKVWISSEYLPFTIWHILALSLILVNCLWAYYCYMIFKYARLLRSK